LPRWATEDDLQQAWRDSPRSAPDRGAAWREIIRAVEDLACPQALANQNAAGTATLGSTLGQLRAQGNARELVAVRRGEAADPT
jgi:hypothetical protein